MKKWLLALGLSGAIVLAGCSDDSEENSNSEADHETTEASESKETDELSVKKELLSAQMNLTNTFKPYQQKVTAYQTALSEEETDEATIETSAEEAKSAANEAATKAADYTIEADLPEDVKTNLQESLPSLQAYYEEVETAINDNIKNADFSSADEKFKEFNDQFGSTLEDAGLLAPNLMEEMS